MLAIGKNLILGFKISDFFNEGGRSKEINGGEEKRSTCETKTVEKKESQLKNPHADSLFLYGGDDGTRTRDLWLDRPVC